MTPLERFETVISAEPAPMPEPECETRQGDSHLDMAETILQNLRTFAEWNEDADPYYLFRANLIVDNGECTHRPVIIEQFPDAISLFGNIDRILVDNKPYADHTMIRAGSILKASGFDKNLPTCSSSCSFSLCP